MSLKGVAQDTLRILRHGGYGEVRFAEEQERAVQGTKLYEPDELARLLEDEQPGRAETAIEVTPETTQLAAQRLAGERPVVLNFASARNPGGGFINGAKAQEEDLARCSGLYPCLLTQPGYYERNRLERSVLYTDHIIYSPGVPFFRTHSRGLLDRPFFASVITAPAPNAGQALLRDADAGPEIETCLRRRAGYVLAVARAQAHRTLVLGAWGCGVFRNDPTMVADAFAAWLEGPFAGAFERVVFAILDRSAEERTRGPFAARFARE